MAVTVADDHTNLHDMDAAGTEIADGNVVATLGQQSTVFKVQGTASVIGQFKAAGVGGMGVDLPSAQDFSDRHIYCWLNNLDVAETDANGGLRIRVLTSGTAPTTNFGEWKTGGRDNRRIFIERFVATCIDCRRPYDFTAGTIPNIASIDGVMQTGNFTSASGQNTWFLDQIKWGSKITVTGGTVASPGISSEVATDDITDGRGSFKNAGGTFYILSGIDIGNAASATDSYFRDQQQVWVFEDQYVKNDFMTIICQGNAAGTQNIRFGTSSGSGTAKEGSSGNVFLAAGITPFQVTAIDSNADVEFYGCTFVGPASLRDDPLRNFKIEDNSASTFTDDTTDANNSTVNDTQAFPTGPALNDAAYFGSDRIFAMLKVNTGTAGVGTYTVTWEYYNGATWAALTDIRDGTDSSTNGTGVFKTTGLRTVTYAVPDNWAKTTVGGANRFWIRARISSFTSMTTIPLLTQCFVSQGCNIRLEASTVEAIRCTFANMETIRVRNGAFLKKSIIANSTTSPKHAALDLGATDPATDTVRDLTIQSCARGILLRPTATATFNFRNIAFSGNAVVSEAIQEDSPSVFTNFTTAANNSTASDITFFPTTEDIGDNFYIGYHSLFNKVEINVGTAGTTGVVQWQYWNGAWTNIPTVGLSDGTNSFKTAGTNNLTFTIPADWVKNTVNNQGPFFYIRANITTTYGTNPLGTQLRAGFDVRVDSPSGATVTLNILEGGTTPVVDNVNNSTIVINNSVNITITVKDKSGTAVNLAQTAVYRTDNNVELMNADTDVNGVATTTFNFTTDTAIYIRVRKSSTGTTRYTPVSTTGTITSSGFSLLVTLETDAIVT